MRIDKIIIKLLLFLFLNSPVLATAGNLDAPGAPAAGSGMLTTTDIFNRLDTGATSSAPGSFQEPGAVPTIGTGKSLADIEGKLPVVDDANGANATEVATGKIFWGLRSDGTWGVKTGIGDSNLISNNIKSGVSIFGVTGAPNVVDTGSGTAIGADIAIGKKAWVGGVELTGGPGCSGIIYNAGAGGTRWCDNGDGSITDMQSGLLWMQDSSGLGPLNWSGALVACVEQVKSGAYGLSDGSVAGDWRLPTKGELSGLASGSEALKGSAPGPFVNVSSSNYWSCTASASSPSSAWSVDFLFDFVYYYNKTSNYYARCVR